MFNYKQLLIFTYIISKHDRLHIVTNSNLICITYDKNFIKINIVIIKYIVLVKI